MTQIANNYIALPKTRSRRFKNRWAYIGAAAAVCGILGVYDVSKARAQSDMTTLREDIFLNMELSLAHYKNKGEGLAPVPSQTQLMLYQPTLSIIIWAS